MTFPNEQLQLDAFVDDELDLATRLDIERRLETDPALRRQVDEKRQLRELVRERASYRAAPESLRRGVRERFAAAPASAPATTTALRRWLGWRPLAASLSLAVMLAISLNLAWVRSSADDRLANEVLASHVRATLGQHLVDVASSDRHTVKPYLSSKLGFSPPVNELQIAGSVFLGGRVDYLQGRTVASLVYRQGEHIVDVFVWPGTASDGPPRIRSDRGYLTAHWSHDGMNHWVISDVNREEFGTLVNAIVAAEAQR